MAALASGVSTYELGSPGQPPLITIGGLGLRNIAMMNDGVPLNDPYRGTYQPSWYPTENIDKAEVSTGPNTFLFGENSTAGVINAISRNRKAIHPYSHLRYSEAAYGAAVVDGMVSQDVARGVNVTGGAQHSTYGPRFTDDSYDCWSGRLRVNYNPSSSLNAFAGELYTQSQTGLNGGIDVSSTPDSIRFDRIQANVVHPAAYEKITRHDLDAGLTFLPSGDTLQPGSVVISYSSQVRELRSGEHSAPPVLQLHQDQRSVWSRIHAGQTIVAAGQSFELGGEFRSQRVLVTPAIRPTQATGWALTAAANLSLDSLLKITPAIRTERYRAETATGVGSTVTIAPTGCTTLSGGYSVSYRFPTIQETEGNDPVVGSHLADGSPEQHRLAAIDFTWKIPDAVDFRAGVSYRKISNSIGLEAPADGDTVQQAYFTRTGERTLKGTSVGMTLRFGSFLLEGSLNYTQQSASSSIDGDQPKWTGTGGFYFRDTLVHGHLGLKAGLRGSFYSSFTGEQFDQISGTYLPAGSRVVLPNNGTLDLVIIAHLGDAYIHFIMDNLLDNQYIMTNFYPMTGRQLRFGVGWSFEN
jgi:outer membrane receptor protein involved in Fe transport